jgi:hypothetical protein
LVSVYALYRRDNLSYVTFIFVANTTHSNNNA